MGTLDPQVLRDAAVTQEASSKIQSVLNSNYNTSL
jgi:hypothetical protein